MNKQRGYTQFRVPEKDELDKEFVSTVLLHRMHDFIILLHNFNNILIPFICN